jgi:hypothetical protein
VLDTPPAGFTMIRNICGMTLAVNAGGGHDQPAQWHKFASRADGLRSRERRFESCWGRSNTASEVIPLDCRNAIMAVVGVPPLCVTGSRLAPVFSPEGPPEHPPGSATPVTFSPSERQFVCRPQCPLLSQRRARGDPRVRRDILMTWRVYVGPIASHLTVFLRRVV